jgi:hypothetical protein
VEARFTNRLIDKKRDPAGSSSRFSDPLNIKVRVINKRGKKKSGPGNPEPLVGVMFADSYTNKCQNVEKSRLTGVKVSQDSSNIVKQTVIHFNKTMLVINHPLHLLLFGQPSKWQAFSAFSMTPQNVVLNIILSTTGSIFAIDADFRGTEETYQMGRTNVNIFSEYSNNRPVAISLLAFLFAHCLTFNPLFPTTQQTLTT